MTLSPQLIAALAEDKELQKDVQAFVASHPEAASLMTRVLVYFKAQLATAAASSQQPDAKRQKLEGIAQFFQKTAVSSPSTSTGSSPTPSGPSSSAAAMSTVVSRPEIGPAVYSTSPLSFLHPVRKKLVLSLHANHIALATTTGSNQEVICQAPYSAIHRIVAVPFLERAAKQTALVIFFRHADLMAQGGGSGAKDSIWAVPLADDGKDFSLTLQDQHKDLVGLTEDLKTSSISTPIPSTSTTHGSLMASRVQRPDQVLICILTYMMRRSTLLTSYNSTDLIPSPGTIDSPSPSPAYPHFSTHLKSNQGTMYLLPTGLLFAFRKPILFLPTTGIEAIGVHSVMTRTFDFEVVLNSASCSVEDLEGVPPESSKESGSGKRTVGFSMVDRKEFERVEDWIKKSGIRDRSLSEDLKAKDKGVATGQGSKKRGRQADGDATGGEDEEEGDGSAGGQQKKSVDDDDDDDEEDEDFAPESDEDHIMEEYDSNPEESGSGNEGQDDAEEDIGEDSSDDGEENEEDDEPVVETKSTKTSTPKVAPKARRLQEEEDLGEESLGEDSADDEDDEEEEEEEEEDEDEDEEGGDEAEEEVEEDELEDD